MDAKSETYDCTYVFSSEKHNEVRKILEKYLPHDTDQMEQLRKLDRSVTRPGSLVSLLLGITGSILHGMGIRYLLTEAGTLSAAGVVVAVAGIVLICSAYPAYRMITGRLRRKIAPQIISLCRELLK